MKNKINVLIVDDNPADSRRLIRLLDRLTNWTIRCRECYTSADAKENIISLVPDVVFVDYLLDTNTGLDLIRNIPDEIRQHCAFVLLTGQGDEDVAVQALRSGVLDYLTKHTLSVENLEHVIRFAVQRIHDRRALQQRDAILKALTMAAAVLLKAAEWRDGIRRLLAILGVASKSTRVSLLQNMTTPSGEIIANALFEWDSKQDGPTHQTRNHFCYTDSGDPRWEEVLVGGEPLFLHTDQFVGEEAERFLAQSIQTTLLVPVFLDGTWWGILKFDGSHREQEFSSLEIEALCTAANAMEAALQREKTEEMMRLQATALETAANVIFITDAQGLFIWANPAFTRTTGYTWEDIQGTTPRIFRSGRHNMSFYHELWNTINEGQVWRGEIVDRHKDGSLHIQETTISPVRDRNGMVTRFVAVQQDVTLRKELEERLRVQAEYDTLTNLPNRRLFEDRLLQTMALAKRNKTSMILMFVDLDRFKEINDTLGHDAGDAVLKEAAGRIVSCVRRSDTVARLGGDEFTVILYNVTLLKLIESVATKILERLNLPFFQGGQAVHISGSIGIAVFPDDGTTPHEMMKCADEAMYHSKKGGRATFSFFNRQATRN